MLAARLRQTAESLGATAAPHPRVPAGLAVVVAAAVAAPAVAAPPPPNAGVIIINRRAGEAVLKGAELYVPGILAASAGILADDPVEIFAAVEEMAGAASGSGDVGLIRGTTLPSAAEFEAQEAAPSVAAAIAEQAARQGGWLAVPIGRGKAQMRRAELFAEAKGLAARVERRAGDDAGAPPPPPPMEALLPAVRGQGMQQNLPSIAAALALSPPRGARVLDMCSAPGGKTTALAWMVAGGMEVQQAQKQQQAPSGGIVVALDRTHAKVDGVRSLARDLGLEAYVDARKMDATQCCGAQEDEDEKVNQQATAAPQLNVKALTRVCRRIGVMRGRRLLTREKVVAELRRNALPEILAESLPEAADEAAALLTPQEMSDEPRAFAAISEAVTAAAMASSSAEMAAAASSNNRRFPPLSFSYILLDAPCSAMGLRPRLAQPVDLRTLRTTAHYQRRLLQQAVRLLAPGGVLVFSTCTISPLENEANVRWVLDTYPEMRLTPSPVHLGGPGLTEPADPERARELLVQFGSGNGSDGASFGASLDADLRWLSKEEAEMVQRFDPAGEEGTIGFFVARFEKDG